MKTIKITLFVFLMGIVCCQAQSKEKTPNSSKEKKQMNLVDEQMKILGGLFSTIDTGEEANPFAGSNNYLEVVDKMDAPEDVKQMIREQYKVYDLSLDPTKKDSLKLMVDKMLKRALEKTQNDRNNNNH